MNDGFGLPPRRELPDDVRARLRAGLHQGMAKRRPSRVWYAAAAAVLVLAVGAVVVTRQLRQPADVPPAVPNGLKLDGVLAKTALDRCWAAVQVAGKTGRVAPREDWVPLFTDEQEGDAVVAATAAGKPMFCETTETTVTLSDPEATPAYGPGSRAGVLLHSPTGLVGGLVDPGWRKADLGTRTAHGDTSSHNLVFSPVSHQFVVLTRTDPARTVLTIGNPDVPSAMTLPPAPPPLLSVTDRPEPADRTSPAGRVLGDCLADAEERIPDGASYRPGPLLEADGYQVVMGRLGDRVVACTREPEYGQPGKTQARAYPDFAFDRRVPARRILVSTLGAVEAGGEPGKSRTPFAAVVPKTAAGVSVGFGGGTSAEGTAVDGMFVVWVPKERYETGVNVTVVARDGRGGVVYEGDLPL
ncbi:hypothetical protein [Amycolatopsis rifamycinica]|uniref:Uncharacterized protein n=1 Tax=Amycolatopsis rifamycinica TaxID=287986 RepID=A0A066U2I2_9PSEU|nr:hypothetical protein [Amycolatopsis rifamycinica]KDN18319.1 hypothetical protein DV20_31255 [Amycolatopsis rifamycinica]